MRKAGLLGNFQLATQSLDGSRMLGILESAALSLSNRSYTKLYRSPGFEKTNICDNGNAKGNVAATFNRLDLDTPPRTRLNFPTVGSIYYTRVFAGSNVIPCTESTKGEWVKLLHMYGSYTGSQAISNHRIQFADGYLETIQQAVLDGYLSPMVFFCGHGTYSWTNWAMLATLNTTGNQSYSQQAIYMRPLKAGITGVSFTASHNSSWSSYFDGVGIEQLDPSVKFSLAPI